MSSENKAWYKEWFNSPYYHLLYKHRDDNEAQTLIDNLVKSLKPSPQWHFLDLACGRGRHAKYLHQKGYEVTGLDLSPRNIEFAQKFANATLHFETADMRQPFGREKYDCILNLFTSFGYFDNLEDSQQACHQMARALKTGGILVLDFMNVHKVELGLIEKEHRQINEIDFQIERKIEDDQVVKAIEFNCADQSYHFEEKVQLLSLKDFETLFIESGLNITAVYGDYQLNPFHAENSDRLILIAQA